MSSTKLTTALAAAALLLPPAWSWHDTRSHAATAIPNGLDAVLPPAPPPRPLFNPNRVALSVDRDPRLAALAEASRQPDALEEDYPRMLDLTQIVFQLEPAQFPDALAILLKMKPSAPAKSLIRVLFSHWAEQDPAAAFAAAPAKGLLREEALSGVLSVWMRQAPDAALAHVSSQLSGEAQEETLLLAFQQLSNLDPRATLERWPAIPDPQVATKVKTTALSLWANRDAPAALAWVRAFDDETSRDTSERTIIDALSTTDPVQAVALAQTMANPRNRDRALTTSLSTLAQHDPAAARQALLSLPPELLHSPELFSAMLQMTYWDPAGMTTILEHLPLAKRDELGMQLAMSWLRLDVRTASAWIHQTTDLSEKSKAALLPLTKP